MNLIFSNVSPLKLIEDQQSFLDCFNEQLKKAESVVIAVDDVSYHSLLELGRIIDENPQIQNVLLIIGMPYIAGFPEQESNEAIRIAKKWRDEQRGEIRLVRPFRYHGNFYSFYSDSEIPYSAITGSADLCVLKPDYRTVRQYDLSILIDEEEALKELQKHFEDLKDERISKNILEILMTDPSEHGQDH